MNRPKKKSQDASNETGGSCIPLGIIGCGWPHQSFVPIYPIPESASREPESPVDTADSDSGIVITDSEDSPDFVSEERSLPKLSMTQATFDAVMQDLATGRFRREQGGILVGPSDAENIAIRYIKDENGHGTFASFTIDFNGLNKEILKVRSQGLICVGIVHSHPDGVSHPSGGDIAFLRRIFANPKNGGGNGFFMFPIVAAGKLHPYLIDTGNECRVLSTDLQIV